MAVEGLGNTLRAIDDPVDLLEHAENALSPRTRVRLQMVAASLSVFETKRLEK